MSNLLLCRHHPAEIGDTNDYELYENQYMTTEALGSGTITFTIPAAITTSYVTNVSYRKNNGAWTTTANSSSAVTITVSVAADDVIEWKGAANKYAISTSSMSVFGGTAQFNVYGNIMSMFYEDAFINKSTYPTNTYVASGLFKASKVVNASNLVLTTASASYAYTQTFMNCSSLIYPPSELRATIIYTDMYRQMFEGCSSMTTMPTILAEELSPGESHYRGMFDSCAALNNNTNQEILADLSCSRCCQDMFWNCTGIVNAPNIKCVGSPTSSTYSTFAAMFQGCTSLETAPEKFDTDTAVRGIFTNTFDGCTSLEVAPIINIRNVIGYSQADCPMFYEMFSGCTSLTDASGINIYFSSNSSWSGYQPFYYMFYNCYNLVQSPSLHINGTLISNHRRPFWFSFYNCQNMEFHDIEINYIIDSNTNITTGSGSTGYVNYCMFQKCSKMKSSPRITRLSLLDKEFHNAFDYCTQLKDVWIKCNADSSNNNGFTNWLANCGTLSGVTRTVHRAGSVTLPTNSTSGVPSGWILDITDWTAQRHARMRIYVATPGGLGVPTLTQDSLNTAYNDPERNCYSFDYYGDTLTFDDETYFVWENNNDPTYKLLTFTDNFYELRLNSYEFGNGEYPYDWTYGIIDSPSTLYYENDYLLDHGWWFIKCIRLQG